MKEKAEEDGRREGRCERAGHTHKSASAEEERGRGEIAVACGFVPLSLGLR